MTLKKELFISSRRLIAISTGLLLSTATTACSAPVTPVVQGPSGVIPTVSIDPEGTPIENNPVNVPVEDTSMREQYSPQPAVAPSRLIEQNALGNAQTCTTPTELQQALPTMTVGTWGEGPLVDTEGVKVTNAEGETIFYALASGWRVGPNRPFTLFYTTHPSYQTAEGIGPGTSIEEAERIYGPATLSYHYEAESREFVTFENGPEDIWFRTGSGDEAGVYAEQAGPYFQTQTYREGATIRTIWVSDRSCILNP